MRPKESVFIDTSVFKAENYFAPHNRIHTLSEFCSKGQITILMPAITEQEIRKHIKSDISSAYKAFNKECKALRNLKGMDDICRKGRERFHIANAIAEFDKFLKRGTVISLNYYKCADVQKVFEAYFTQEPPFSEGKKKSEFPDAFVLVGLERYAEKIGSKVIVLSEDGDFGKYKSPYLEMLDYKTYVDMLLSDEEEKATIKEFLVSESNSIKEKVLNAVTELLDSLDTYSFMYGGSIITGVDTEYLDVEVEPLNYYIARVADDFLEIELKCHIAYKVQLSYENYDTASYDREDGVWYNVESDTIDKYGNSEVTISIDYIKPKSPTERPAINIVDFGIDNLVDQIRD